MEMPTFSFSSGLEYVRGKAKAFRALGPKIQQQAIAAKLNQGRAILAGRKDPAKAAAAAALAARYVQENQSAVANYNRWRLAVNQLDRLNAVLAKAHLGGLGFEPVTTALVSAAVVAGLAAAMYIAEKYYADSASRLALADRQLSLLEAGKVTPQQYDEIAKNTPNVNAPPPPPTSAFSGIVKPLVYVGVAALAIPFLPEIVGVVKGAAKSASRAARA